VAPYGEVVKTDGESLANFVILYQHLLEAIDKPVKNLSG
jgi:hypothetical protein